MSFNDIFTDSFLETSTNLSAIQVGATILLSFLIGLFIYQIYRRTYQSVVYTKSFSTSLIMMSMITSLVILAVTSNIVLSLGMVGALSIVRFRTAIKDPMDIVFMFWSIAVGLVTGAGFYALAIVGSLFIGVILYIFSVNTKNETPYLLLVSFGKEQSEQEVMNIVKDSVAKYAIRSKTVQKDNIELTIELRFKAEELGFINKVQAVDSVYNAVLVSNNEFSN